MSGLSATASKGRRCLTTASFAPLSSHISYHNHLYKKLRMGRDHLAPATRMLWGRPLCVILANDHVRTVLLPPLAAALFAFGLLGFEFPPARAVLPLPAGAPPFFLVALAAAGAKLSKLSPVGAASSDTSKIEGVGPERAPVAALPELRRRKESSPSCCTSPRVPPSPPSETCSISTGISTFSSRTCSL
mmetsp:Transcript_56623/g.112457  ORF Transcript_56623/g.112457 Transcript_56623/m.112457 type:complete len:189 (+) Transcript_56623:130-696(+)